MKEGDIVICRKSCIMRDTGHVTTTVNQRYEIIKMSARQFVIIDDEGEEHFFNKESEYFCTQQILRNEKLRKLKQVINE